MKQTSASQGRIIFQVLTKIIAEQGLMRLNKAAPPSTTH